MAVPHSHPQPWTPPPIHAPLPMHEEDNQIHVPPSFLAVYADSRQRLLQIGQQIARQGRLVGRQQRLPLRRANARHTPARC